MRETTPPRSRSSVDSSNPMACISITLGGASCIPLSCPGVGWSTNDIYYLRYDNVIEPERTVPSEPLSLKVKEVLDDACIVTGKQIGRAHV